MLMPMPRLEKFDTIENARRVLCEPQLSAGWNQTDNGTYLVDVDAGFVRVQIWEVNAIYEMLDIVVGDQRLLIKLEAKIRELRGVDEARLRFVYHGDERVQDLLRWVRKCVQADRVIGDVLGGCIEYINTLLADAYKDKE